MQILKRNARGREATKESGFSVLMLQVRRLTGSVRWKTRGHRRNHNPEFCPHDTKVWWWKTKDGCCGRVCDWCHLTKYWCPSESPDLAELVRITLDGRRDFEWRSVPFERHLLAWAAHESDQALNVLIKKFKKATSKSPEFRRAAGHAGEVITTDDEAALDASFDAVFRVLDAIWLDLAARNKELCCLAFGPEEAATGFFKCAPQPEDVNAGKPKNAPAPAC
jgi:hypothetical protein